MDTENELAAEQKTRNHLKMANCVLLSVVVVAIRWKMESMCSMFRFV